MESRTDPVAITVVIPCFDVAESIEAAIGSVLGQRGVDVEIVCVDDGSRDATDRLLTRWADDGVVRYIRQADNQGASVARNRGLAVARGEAIQFLDADDVLLQDKLRRQLDIMKTSGADIVAGAYERVNLADARLAHQPDDDPWGGLLDSRLGRTSSNLFGKGALEAVAAWREGLASSQEYDLMFRLLRSDARAAVDHVVGARLHARRGSISRGDVAGNALRFIRLREEMMEYLANAGLLTDYRSACFDRAARRARHELAEHTEA